MAILSVFFSIFDQSALRARSRRPSPAPFDGTADGGGSGHGRQGRPRRGGRGRRDARRATFEDVDEDVEALDDVSEQILHQRHHVPIGQHLPFGRLLQR